MGTSGDVRGYRSRWRHGFNPVGTTRLNRETFAPAIEKSGELKVNRRSSVNSRSRDAGLKRRSSRRALFAREMDRIERTARRLTLLRAVSVRHEVAHKTATPAPPPHPAHHVEDGIGVRAQEP
jgi:hypothetical protein